MALSSSVFTSLAVMQQQRFSSVVFQCTARSRAVLSMEVPVTTCLSPSVTHRFCILQHQVFLHVTNLFSNMQAGNPPTPKPANHTKLPAASANSVWEKFTLCCLPGSTKKPTRSFFYHHEALGYPNNQWGTQKTPTRLFWGEKGRHQGEAVSHQKKELNVRLFLLPIKKD